MLISLFLAKAWASTVYPAELATVAGMPCSPTCTVCHATNSGGLGTVTAEFGLAMMDHGLTGGADTELLGTTFEALAAEAIDSDGDGTTDADELAAGFDPNPDGADLCGSAEEVVMPSYGCFNSSATPASVVGAFGGLLAVVLGRRRVRA